MGVMMILTMLPVKLVSVFATEEACSIKAGHYSDYCMVMKCEITNFSG